MPKIVDHDKRRHELVAATWRVICRVGLHNTTVGLIAKEAGYSHGIVAHYFSNKADVLFAAHQLKFTRLKEAGDALLIEAAEQPAAAKLRTLFDWMLPLDAERLTEAEVELNFWGQAVTTDALLTARTESLKSVLDEWWVPLIAGCRADGLLVSGGTDESVAKSIMAFIDGVSAYSVLFPDFYGFEQVGVLGVEFLAGIISSVPEPLIPGYPF